MLVAINQSTQLSATVAETLTFAITGLPGLYSGTDKMAGCAKTSGFGADDEDGTLLTQKDTTAVAVPFGNLNGSSGYQACQRLSILTNAGNGYTIYSSENNPLETGGGSTINDTTCNSGTCTPTTSGAWTTGVPNWGLGISCVKSATSASCSTSNPNWNGGVNFAPISAASASLSPAKFAGLSSVTSALVLVKVKYRLLTPAVMPPAGTYTNLVSWIATPVF
jgi:hypothetical protein